MKVPVVGLWRIFCSLWSWGKLPLKLEETIKLTIKRKYILRKKLIEHYYYYHLNKNTTVSVKITVKICRNRAQYNVLIWRNCFLLVVFYLYLEFCASLHCISGSTELSVKLLDNVLTDCFFFCFVFPVKNFAKQTWIS